jgi:hypothetical protein
MSRSDPPPSRRRTPSQLRAVRELMRQRLERKRKRADPDEQNISQGGAPPLFHDMLIIPPAGSVPNAPAGTSKRSELFRVPVVKRPPAARAPGTAGTGGRSTAGTAVASPNQAAVIAKSPGTVVGNTAVESGARADSGFPDAEARSGEQPVPAEIAGDYIDLPEKLDLYDYAQRRTMTIARPHEWGPQNTRARGPAFGTLPVKREPAATHCFACYLVDAENFSFRNAWTAEEWNDIAPEDLPPHPSADDSAFEVLLAAPRGKVFYLRLKLENDQGEDSWPSGKSISLSKGEGSLESLNLRHEVEIWNQLRNGVVAGRVMSRRKAVLDGRSLEDVEYVPIVNVTSLVPDEPSEPRSKE